MITGINASQSSVESGSNDHARVYSFADEKWVHICAEESADGRLAFVNGQKTITANWSDDYPYQVSYMVLCIP